MYKNKKDVDKHVEKLMSKLSVKEFKTRAYSIARLYFETGDYASCQKYVEQYLTQKDNNAAAYKLLGQALQKLGQKEKAFEQYKISLDIDPAQTSTILEICELLIDDDITIDPGRARYWCDKAEAIFPKHPVSFRLREKLVTITNPNPEALVELLTAELTVRPKDALIHARLLKHYLHSNQINEAVTHSCNVEFGSTTFRNNYAWYETLTELLKHNSHNHNDWLYQLLLLTVRERMCVLSITETPSLSKSLVESNELLFLYDQDIEKVNKAGAAPGFGEFHASLLNHHKGQLAFHLATFLLKKAKKGQMSWRDASQFAAPLMLTAWHTLPIDIKMSWLTNAPDKQQQAARRWRIEAAYRCSQTGHYLISNSQDKTQQFIDRTSQCCSGTHWRDKLYEKIFTSRNHLAKIKSSYFASSKMFSEPNLRLPRKMEVEAFDNDAQMEYANSLHHYVWILLNYKNYAQFRLHIFETLTPNASNNGPESMNKIDVHAFLYSAALTCRQQKLKDITHTFVENPTILPANITDLLCSLPQMKWWDCAYKFSQNELGTDLTDIRTTLSKGIEVVRCMDHHGLDPELLCKLGKIFNEKGKLTTVVEEKNNLESRAKLYYLSAIPLLEKLKSKIVIKIPERRLFDCPHKELSTKELYSLLEESKLYIAMSHINDYEYDNAIQMLSNLKSPEALFHLSQTYRKIALEENNQTDKYVTMLLKSRNIAYKAMEAFKNSEINKHSPLYSDTQELIEELVTVINKIDPDLSSSAALDIVDKYSSDENISVLGNEHMRNSHIFRNVSSTPKATVTDRTNYRSAIDSQILENTRIDQRYLERIETEIKNLQKRESVVNDFMNQTKTWFEENRKLGNEIITTIHSNIQSTADQFKLLKISVDQVKAQIDESKSESKDVGELKKQIAEMKKEINKLKKGNTEQNINETDLYNIEDDYRATDNNSTFPAQLPFAPQMMPPFNQRLVPPFTVPPNPYQLYGQNLYNLYTQYAQFGQTPQVPGAPPIFDPTRSQISYPGVFPTPEAMYLDVAHLVPPMPTVPSATAVGTTPVATTLPPVSSVSTVPSMTTSAPVSNPKTITKTESKDIPRSLPMNVITTSSNPPPIHSSTIPSTNIKGTPHNYQIPMPVTSETKTISPPAFCIPTSDSKSALNTGASITSWDQTSVFKNAPTSNGSTLVNTANDSIFSSPQTQRIFDNSKSVVDGILNSNSFNTSGNKSRTLSEKSNTSVEYDPCPDFKPIIPLPAEVKVTTGEENETIIFRSRAKLFRFIDKQWKERGLGEMKLLKHNVTGRVRVLMRREQIHKICANHIITSDMEISPMKNETKAYFWVANDFAEEKLILEKFCIRFKTADIAKEFYDIFENARTAPTVDKIETPKTDKSNKNNTTTGKLAEQLNTPVKLTFNTNNTLQTNKSGFSVGGLTFTSTPTLKTVTDDVKTDIKTTENSTPKVNIFSSLSFKTNNSSPFNNIFNTQTNAAAANSNPSATETTTKLNSSDTVEEFEPNVDFKPVVPLPALVEQLTGEENENILFEHRAKLFRFDSGTKEWKERGLGNIKLLVRKDNIHKVRLLMRREQIMKVCCNHALTKDISLQKMPKMDNAVTWCAQDFSDGELVAETFCLRFKTIQICDDFIDAIKQAQTKMKEGSIITKEDNDAGKQSTEVGFGDKFKPKPGAWCCDACYTNNLENFDKCACCEQTKPQNSNTVGSTTNSNNENIKTAPTSLPNWGDAFKPKPGSWECKECFVRNESTVENCTACNNPKNPAASQSTVKVASGESFKFKFGIPAQPATNTQTVKPPEAQSIASSWGDRFKPSEGTWECKQCYIRNEAVNENCSACANARNPIQKEISNNSSISAGPKFTFGIPTESNNKNSENNNKTSSIFDGTGAHTFSFGIPSTTQIDSTNVITFGKQTTPQEPKSQTVLNFSMKKKDELTVETPKTPPNDKTNSLTFGVKEGAVTFDFVFKPKTPTKGKSPAKTPNQKGDESDENEYASEDEGHHIHFSPVIPLPDKVEVVTGEENENILYEHRAKLFRFISGEWKERGIGIIKILKHKDTEKLRIVMRREQVLKICLNHALTQEVIYNPKDDKTWLFAANDFSEGELSLQQFCIRFKTKEIATEFKDAVENARGNIMATIKKESDGDDVTFVSEILSSAEEKQKAKELMLPENFFTYKVKEPCIGCRGCDSEDIQKSKTFADIPKNVASISTPVKTSTFTFQSPTNSFYGTPTNFDKTADVTMFRTPLGSLGSNTKSATPITANNDGAGFINITNKENMLTPKPANIFGGQSEQKILFATPQNKTPTNVIGTTAAPTATSKGLILAPPKLNSIGAPQEEKNPTDPKSLFESANNNPDFPKKNTLFGNSNSGTSMNKSIFGFSATEKKSEDSAKPEVKSLFGGDNQKPINLFSGSGQNSLFGPGSLAKSNSIFGGGNNFGSNFNKTGGFGNGNSIFGSKESPGWTLDSSTEQKKPDVTPVETMSKKPDVTNTFSDEPKDSPFKLDQDLSFAALSSSTPAFAVQKNSDFKWEGAGQQLFVKSQKDHNKSNNDSNDTAGADEEYDPHYEPIVPLPDKIVVKTGEEDEEKIFGERCKLYRYDDNTQEWKERGIGELKILHHPNKNSYRLLLRREQVHKAVLNMLIFADLQVLPMKKSNSAFVWVGRNYAESSTGDQETLSVKFKSAELANSFHEKVSECIRKLQAPAAVTVKDNIQPVESPSSIITPLRLPKHLQDNARADNAISAKAEEHTQSSSQAQSFPKTETKPNGEVKKTIDPSEVFRQVVFKETVVEEVQQEDDDEDGYEHDYEQNEEDYDGYYNEEEDDSAAYYTCEGEAIVRQGASSTKYELAHIQVLYDQEICSPKILVTDAGTGEILADMLIHTDTEFQMCGDSCSWSGVDYTSNMPVDKAVTINFHDSDTAMQFYDSCETSKAATYSSTDPDS